jgi:hypothetical protein
VQYSLAAAMEGLGTEAENKEFPFLPFLKDYAFTFLSCSKKTRISEQCSSSVPAENEMSLLLPNVLWHQKMRKYCKCYKHE